MRAVTYSRVSYDDRAQTGGRNLEGQVSDCRAYCQQKGYTVIAELAEDDRGASGASWDLPQLNEALDMARRGEFDVLVVRELDRFARGLAKQLIVESEFRSYGVDIEYLIGEYPDTPEGQLSKNIKAVIAEYEREQIARRMTRGRRNVVKSGRVMLHGDNRSPFGYRSEGGLMVICEAEARIVKQIYTWYVIGDENGKRLASKGIATRLAAMHVPTWAASRDIKTRAKSGPCEWSWRSVMDILTDETYTGKWTYGKHNSHTGQTNPQEHWLTVEVPAIVSREVWEKAQEQKTTNTTLAKRNTRYVYVMQGRLNCSCGCRVSCCSTQVRGRTYFYYRCNARGGSIIGATCKAPGFRVEDVDNAAWQWVRDLMGEPERIREKYQEYREEQGRACKPLQDRLAIIDDLLAQKRPEQERCFQAYISGMWPEDVALREKAQLDRIVSDLERERSDLAAAIAGRLIGDEQVKSFEDFVSNWRVRLSVTQWVDEWKRELIEALDVRGVLAIEDGQRVLYARCRVGEAALLVTEPWEVIKGEDGVTSIMLRGSQTLPIADTSLKSPARNTLTLPFLLTSRIVLDVAQMSKTMEVAVA